MRQELIDAYTSLLKVCVTVTCSKETEFALDNARRELVAEMTNAEWEVCLRRNGL